MPISVHLCLGQKSIAILRWGEYNKHGLDFIGLDWCAIGGFVMKKRTFILLVSLFLCVGVLVVCLGDFIFLLGDQMVVRTIEEKCDGVGEAFQADLSLGGVWVNNPVDANLAYFQGFVDPSMPFDDLGRW